MVIDNPLWEIIFVLREICSLLQCVKISIGQVAYLKSLIKEYIELRLDLFPNIKLRPKHHYLTHYPDLIIKFGPLKHLWTLRYESKHRYFKNILKHSPNFKNILFSLSERHQLLQAMHATEATIFADKVISEELSVFNYNDYSNDVSSVISKVCLFENLIFLTSKANFRGINYTSGMHIVYDKSEEGGYLLCKIKYVLINNSYDDIIFFGNKVEIIKNKLLCLYENKNIYRNTDVVCIYYKDLLSFEPLLHYTTSHNVSFFSFKSAVFEHL